MEKSKRNKILRYLLKTGSIVVSCFFPMWAICEKFPIWSEGYGTGRSVGVGAILICVVFLIIFRKTVVSFVNDKLKLDHAPPIAIWLILLVISYILLFISSFLRDLTIVLWMGAIGCAIGNLLTIIGERFFSVNKEKYKDPLAEVEDDE